MGKNIFLFLAVAIVLCFAGLHNKFPLITPNSGMFINAGFRHSLTPISKSFYGLFVAHASWGLSIWFVIFSQSLLLTTVLFYCFRFLGGGVVDWPYFLLYAFFLNCTTAASVTVSMIDPAIFGAITILASGLLWLVPDLPRRDQWILMAILLLCALMSSIYLLYLSIVTLAGTFVLFRNGNMYMGRYARLLGVLFGGWLLSVICRHVLPVASFQQGEVLMSTAPYVIGVDIIREGYDSPSYYAINKWFSLEVRQYVISRQFQGWLYYTYLNYAIISTAVIGFVGCLLLARRYLVPVLYLLSGLLLQSVIAAVIYPGMNQELGGKAWLLTLPAWFYVISSRQNLYPKGL